MDKNGKYTSNKINTRRVFGEANHGLSNTALANLTHGQHKTIRFKPADDVVFKDRVMPSVGDEHIWMESSSGTAAGPSGVTTTAIAAKTAENLSGNGNPYITSAASWTTVGTSYSAILGGFVLTNTQKITSTNYSLLQNQTYRIRVNYYSDSNSNVLRIYSSSGVSTTVALPAQTINSGADHVTIKTHTSVDSTTAKVEIESTGATMVIFSVEVLIPQELSFPVSHDTWGLAGSDGVGAYVALVPKKNSSHDNIAKPWLHTPTDNSTLWKDWHIGQVTEYAAGTPSTITVQIGVVPPIGDYKDLYLGWNKQDYEGYTPVSGVGHTDCYHIYDLSWWIVRGGLFGLRVDIGGLNYSMYQYDDIPGGVNNVDVLGSSEYYDDYIIPSANQAILEGLMTQGNEIHGQFKAIRVSTVDNDTAASGQIHLTVAPNER
tara:strand:+ start:1010 stop:2305 length:1296 start_codon:yes stop_codon:yes gene_type:complete